MKIVQLNVTCGVGSTGKICLAVSNLLNERGVENYILFSEDIFDVVIEICRTFLVAADNEAGAAYNVSA